MAAKVQRELDQFARDVDKGLGSKPKHLLPQYFYDEEGSRLFERICSLPEYYLTRTEAGILAGRSHEIIGALGNENAINIVELGSGTSTKTRILFRALLAKDRGRLVRYYPIDISHTVLQDTANMLAGDFANLRVSEITGDYESGLENACGLIGEQQKMIIFLGSSIGNLEHDAAVAFLRKIRGKLNRADALLVGFDMEKDADVLESAYDDRAGVTARFNLNILKRINGQLEGRFDLSSFAHRALYNTPSHRVEMHLVSKKDQSVHVGALGKSYEFKKGESVHTESSYKYSVERIESLAEKSGLQVKKHLLDDKKWFDLCLLHAP
ncbi:MAG: L-histidine N(alpha)-methyltransferase [Nitrososphaera sp.]|uniref:L-histidine N(alpha)-methyltransferase n=1 Tax=Nitrososphaera sp. TaxID=1971748 RepID=UPI003D6DECE4